MATSADLRGHGARAQGGPLPTSTKDIPETLAAVPHERWPRHIAIIMDGNGRWAQRQNLPRIEGHRRGVASVRRTTEECARLGIEQLTLFCLSSENWKRPPAEIDFLMHLLEQYMIEERTTIMDNNLRVRMIGRREGIPDQVLRELDKTVDMSAANSGMWLNLAVNYGGRSELVDAVRAIGAEIAAGKVQPREVDEQHDRQSPLHRGPRRSGPAHPHRGRAADQQFSALADQLRGNLGHRPLLAGIRRADAPRRHRRFRRPPSQIRRPDPVSLGPLNQRLTSN